MCPGGRSILLVEDEGLIALAERRRLEAQGYRVSHARSGEAALELVKSGDPAIDLVLMDIDLGRGMTGVEAARGMLEERELPVIFLTSHMEATVLEKAGEIAYYGYVPKGSGTAILDATIRAAFRLLDAFRHEKASGQPRALDRHA